MTVAVFDSRNLEFGSSFLWAASTAVFVYSPATNLLHSVRVFTSDLPLEDIGYLEWTGRAAAVDVASIAAIVFFFVFFFSFFCVLRPTLRRVRERRRTGEERPPNPLSASKHLITLVLFGLSSVSS